MCRPWFPVKTTIIDDFNDTSLKGVLNDRTLDILLIYNRCPIKTGPGLSPLRIPFGYGVVRHSWGPLPTVTL